MQEDLKLIFEVAVEISQTIAIIADLHSFKRELPKFESVLKSFNYSLAMEPELGFSPDFACLVMQRAISLKIVYWSSSFERLNSCWSNGHELMSAA